MIYLKSILVGFFSILSVGVLIIAGTVVRSLIPHRLGNVIARGGNYGVTLNLRSPLFWGISLVQVFIGKIVEQLGRLS